MYTASDLACLLARRLTYGLPKRWMCLSNIAAGGGPPGCCDGPTVVDDMVVSLFSLVGWLVDWCYFYPGQRGNTGLMGTLIDRRGKPPGGMIHDEIARGIKGGGEGSGSKIYIRWPPKVAISWDGYCYCVFVCEVTPAGLSRLQYFGHRLGAICIRVCSPVDLSGALPPP